MAERFIDWLIALPSWLKGTVGLIFVGVGIGIMALLGRFGFTEGGKIGGVLVAIGIVLILLWANDA